MSATAAAIVTVGTLLGVVDLALSPTFEVSALGDLWARASALVEPDALMAVASAQPESFQVKSVPEASPWPQTPKPLFSQIGQDGLPSAKGIVPIATSYDAMGARAFGMMGAGDLLRMPSTVLPESSPVAEHDGDGVLRGSPKELVRTTCFDRNNDEKPCANPVVKPIQMARSASDAITQILEKKQKRGVQTGVTVEAKPAKATRVARAGKHREDLKKGVWEITGRPDAFKLNPVRVAALKVKPTAAAETAVNASEVPDVIRHADIQSYVSAGALVCENNGQYLRRANGLDDLWNLVPGYREAQAACARLAAPRAGRQARASSHHRHG